MNNTDKEEHGVLALMFGYQYFDAALRAMDSLGDERSAITLNQLRTDWEGSGNIPNLSHETPFGHVQLAPTRDDVVQVCTGMIDAYDSMRESGERAKLSLRSTIEALFELRAFARLQPSEVMASNISEAPANILHRELCTFLLNTGQVNKLKKGGFVQLGDIKGVPATTIAGKCGMTEKQVETVDGIISNYLLATVELEEIGFRTEFETQGKVALGESFEATGISGFIWLLTYKTLADCAEVQKKDWEFHLDAMAGGSERVWVKVRQFFKFLKARGPAGEPTMEWESLVDEKYIFGGIWPPFKQMQLLVACPYWIVDLRSEDVERPPLDLVSNPAWIAHLHKKFGDQLDDDDIANLTVAYINQFDNDEIFIIMTRMLLAEFDDDDVEFL